MGSAYEKDGGMRSPGMTRRSFLIGLGGTVASVGGVVGYVLRDKFDLATTQNWKDESGSRGLNSSVFDVCIIGSGPAGAVLGTALVERGIRTIIVESGPDLKNSIHDPRIGKLEVFRSSGALDYPVGASQIRAIGGTSNIWTGRCSRLHPSDFEENAYTPKNASWPITYAEIEPYYEQAERTLGVAGGKLSKYQAPRKSDLPLPAKLDISGLKALLDGVGITVDDSPTSTRVNGSGPLRVAADLVPQFSASRHGTLVSGMTVTRLIPDTTGRIIEAEARSLDGNVNMIRARIFVVACGGIESARLLLLSRSPQFPNGIGNNHDRVGRCFMEHPNVTFSGKIRHTWNTISPDYELGRSHQFYDQFKRQGLGSVILVFIQSWVFPDELKNWDFRSVAGKISNMVGRITQAELRIGATIEMRPSDTNRVTLSSDLKDLFGNPGTDVSISYTDDEIKTLEGVRSLIRKIYADLGAEDVEEMRTSWSHHLMGTCRMGRDPTTSVVDRNLRVHDSPNLYVASSAVFVTGGAAHPTPAITALSHRLADHLIRRLQKEKSGLKTAALQGARL